MHATNTRAINPRRAASQVPATLPDVTRLVKDLEAVGASIANTTAADDAVFERPPAATHYTHSTLPDAGPYVAIQISPTRGRHQHPPARAAT